MTENEKDTSTLSADDAIATNDATAKSLITDSNKVESVLKSPKYSAGNPTNDDTSDASAPTFSSSTNDNSFASNPKRVSFSHVENTEDEFQPTPKGQKATRSARFGKSDPVRDLGIFGIILILFYVVSMNIQNVGRTIEDDGGEMVHELTQTIASGGGGGSGGASAGTRSSSLSRLKQMRNALGSLLEQQLDGKPLREDCDLFYARSSIPETGLGVFAGRNYSIGDEIMILSTPSMMIVEESSTSQLWISPESLLFKHHPVLFNVQPSQSLWTTTTTKTKTKTKTTTIEASTTSAEPSSTMIVLKATQPIIAGQEFLLRFDQHLHSVLPEWFDQMLPSHEDYKEADHLIMETRNTFREPKGPRGRKTNQYQQTGIVGQGLRMIQRVVARYRPAVSKLMPIALQSLSEYRGRADEVTSLYLALHNQTSRRLGRYGLCVSDVQQQQEKQRVNGANTAAGVTITRNVTQGGRVHPMPVLVRLKSEGTIEQECRTDEGDGDDDAKSCQVVGMNTPCWSRPDALVELCPLQPLVSIVGGDDVATVKLQWSTWQEAMDMTDLDLSIVQDKKQRLEKIWMLELVALQDLTEGDTLTIQMEHDTITGNWMLPRGMFPAKWLL